MEQINKIYLLNKLGLYHTMYPQYAWFIPLELFFVTVGLKSKFGGKIYYTSKRSGEAWMDVE